MFHTTNSIKKKHFHTITSDKIIIDKYTSAIKKNLFNGKSFSLSKLYIWRHPNRSELTPHGIQSKLTHLGFHLSFIYTLS